MRKNSLMRRAMAAGLCAMMSSFLLAGCQTNTASETTQAAAAETSAQASEGGGEQSGRGSCRDNCYKFP